MQSVIAWLHVQTDYNPDMKDEILIRRSRTADAAKLRACMASIWHATYDGFIGAARVDQFVHLWLADAQLQKEAESESIVSLLALDHEEIIGQVLVRETQPGVIRIARLYLSAQYHGLGLGKRLLEQGIAAFPEAHLACLEVYEPNQHAVGFYRAYGFVETAREQSEFAPEGINEIFMAMAL